MVFVKRDAKARAGFSVGVVLSRKSTKGTVGIEIEVEGSKLPRSQTPAPWAYHTDGSLRGEENAEYVLQQPVEFREVKPSLDVLWAKFREMNSRLDDSNRTSVHVHLNVQEFFFNRLTSLMALYFTFEEVLTEWCGEHRVGNLFCLRAKDAPAIISQIRRFIRSDGKAQIQEHHHYSGLNANALHKFGSLEFRSLRGCSDPETILDWVSILERLYVLSGEFTDPRDVCNAFSSEGPMGFFDSVLGDLGPVVRKGVKMDEAQIRQSMYEGIRLAQDLCYCRDWSLFKGVELKPDPFGRSLRTLIKRLTGGGDTQESALAQAMAAYSSVEEQEDDGIPSNWAPPHHQGQQIIYNNGVQTITPIATQPIDPFAHHNMIWGTLANTPPPLATAPAPAAVEVNGLDVPVFEGPTDAEVDAAMAELDAEIAAEIQFNLEQQAALNTQAAAAAAMQQATAVPQNMTEWLATHMNQNNGGTW